MKRHRFCFSFLMIILYLIFSPCRDGTAVAQKTTVNVPNVIGFERGEAEKSILEANLKVGRVIEKDTRAPQGQVIAQKPVGGSKVSDGSSVILVISTGKHAAAPQANQPAKTTQPKSGFQFTRILKRFDKDGDNQLSAPEWKGKPEIFNRLDKDGNGFVTQKEFDARQSGASPPVEPSHSSKPPEELSIRTGPLIMTGIRAGDLSIHTAPLIMTGNRINDLNIRTDALIMTGERIESIEIRTAPLIMTGERDD